jgi:hypothetical protein
LKADGRFIEADWFKKPLLYGGEGVIKAGA